MKIGGEFEPISVFDLPNVGQQELHRDERLSHHLLEPTPEIPLYSVELRVSSNKLNPQIMLLVNHSKQPYSDEAKEELSLPAMRRVATYLGFEGYDITRLIGAVVFLDGKDEANYTVMYTPLEKHSDTARISSVVRMIHVGASSLRDYEWECGRDMTKMLRDAQDQVSFDIPETLVWFNFIQQYLTAQDQGITAQQVHENPFAISSAAGV